MVLAAWTCATLCTNRDLVMTPSMQVVKHGSSFLSSLTAVSVLREGQLLEIPGLGNGTSVCSEDSRIDDLPAAEVLVSSPRGNPFGQQRTSPLVCANPYHYDKSGATQRDDVTAW
jgi:hypothetical protein